MAPAFGSPVPFLGNDKMLFGGRRNLLAVRADEAEHRSGHGQGSLSRCGHDECRDGGYGL